MKLDSYPEIELDEVAFSRSKSYIIKKPLNSI